jgi:predicted  nucleic acid-binding Zn-ribbon protein
MAGHEAGMAKEDPVPFTRDMEKALQDIVSYVKAGSLMDARSGVSRLTSATDKVLPHITDAALKTRLDTAVNGIKKDINSGAADLFELEEKAESLQKDIQEAREKLRGMGN